MPIAPEAGQFLEIFFDGAPPTLEAITSLPQRGKVSVWDPERRQPAFVIRTDEGDLQIETGDLEHPELYSINPQDALKDALEQWKRVKADEARQNKDYLEHASF